MMVMYLKSSSPTITPSSPQPCHGWEATSHVLKYVQLVFGVPVIFCLTLNHVMIYRYCGQDSKLCRKEWYAAVCIWCCCIPCLLIKLQVGSPKPQDQLLFGQLSISDKWSFIISHHLHHNLQQNLLLCIVKMLPKQNVSCWNYWFVNACSRTTFNSMANVDARCELWDVVGGLTCYLSFENVWCFFAFTCTWAGPSYCSAIHDAPHAPPLSWVESWAEAWSWLCPWCV